MSDDYSDIYDDIEDTQTQQGGPKALRDAYEREKESRKALEERLAALESETRTSKLTDALKASGVDPRVAGLVPNDVTPDKVGDWLSTYGELFGAKPAQEPAAPALSAEEQAALEGVSGAPSGTTSSTTIHDIDTVKGLDNEEDFAKAMGWR